MTIMAPKGVPREWGITGGWTLSLAWQHHSATENRESVQSSRALGVFALSAVILAAISFGAVDIVISNDRSSVVPAPAVLFAVIGTVALLASVVPAFAWMVRTLRHPHLDADIEPMPVPVSAVSFEDDDL